MRWACLSHFYWFKFSFLVPKPRSWQKHKLLSYSNTLFISDKVMNSRRISKEFSENSQRISKEFSKHFQRIPIEFPKKSQKKSQKFPKILKISRMWIFQLPTSHLEFEIPFELVFPQIQILIFFARQLRVTILDCYISLNVLCTKVFGFVGSCGSVPPFVNVHCNLQ